MKNFKAILELIMAIAGYFFRNKQKNENNRTLPSVSDPPFSPDEGNRGNPGNARHDPDPDRQTEAEALNILGWCLILTATTAYIYNQLV